MRILAALLVALPLAASAQYEPAYESAPPGGFGPRRSPLYFAVGLGTGAGAYVWNGVTETFLDWNYDPPRASTSGSFNFQVGATLSERLLVGFDYTLVGVTSSDAGFTTGVYLHNTDAIVTYFPQGEGFYLRGGGGLSYLTFVDDSFVDSSQTYGGVNATVGIGYALWLGRSLNLTFGADASGQRYSGSGPSSSRALALTVGLAWY
jgi:hypothetical protein